MALMGPSDHTGSNENLFQGCKIDRITHLKPCIAILFPSFFLYFRHFLKYP